MNNKNKKRIIKWFEKEVVIIAVIFFVCGCQVGSMLQTVIPAKTKTFTVTEVDYDEAFSKALKTANELRFNVLTSDKASGTFYAQRGSGYIEFSELNFFLERLQEKKHQVTLRVKSSKPESVINNFMKVYGKYVKILPLD
ncbi:MAG TPA: hypothetical protein ENG63_10315 [Candidatus Desulfofervidus auxilii]|uniref:Uncharacterized protein n=1 Tax=Desulfofervidus auxilii TaxID=1621989 RepID=A0A7C0YBF0_DESA2|nr:hypothetical protein [Candidatus Desulfofervidus auxilii]